MTTKIIGRMKYFVRFVIKIIMLFNISSFDRVYIAHIHTQTYTFYTFTEKKMHFNLKSFLIKKPYPSLRSSM